MLATIDATVKQADHRGGGRPSARTAILKNIELTLNSSERVGLELSEWIGAGDWRLLFLNRDRMRRRSSRTCSASPPPT